jgi:hypothetical protein
LYREIDIFGEIYPEIYISVANCPEIYISGAMCSEIHISGAIYPEINICGEIYPGIHISGAICVLSAYGCHAYKRRNVDLLYGIKHKNIIVMSGNKQTNNYYSRLCIFVFMFLK